MAAVRHLEFAKIAVLVTWPISACDPSFLFQTSRWSVWSKSVKGLRRCGGRKWPFPITLASGLYNSLYYRTSRDKQFNFCRFRAPAYTNVYRLCAVFLYNICCFYDFIETSAPIERHWITLIHYQNDVNNE